MTPEEFRRAGHELVDWITDYLEGVGERPVSREIRPGAISARLP